MNITDFEKGTSYIVLCKSDFKDEYRFEAYCKFMGVHENAPIIVVPIDYERAMRRVTCK